MCIFYCILKKIHIRASKINFSDLKQSPVPVAPKSAILAKNALYSKID